MAINYYTDTREDSIDAEELALYNAIMSYRQQNGLDTIPLSKALTTVAARHTLDTVYNVGSYAGHSWSDAPYNSADSSTYPNMWEAPQRLNTGYTGDGFEITTGYAGTSVQTQNMTAARALENWQNSTPHDNVILNRGIWTTMDWDAIGVAIHQGIAHVWFGAATDPTGQPVFEGVTAPGPGTSGNDGVTLQSLTGPTDLGDGIDSVTVGTNQSGATVTKTANGITISTGGQSVDVTNVERLVFNDGTLVIDTGFGENGGMAYRIYQAAFARQPDNGGLTYWLGEMDKGVALKQIAAGFLASPEFQQIYGSNPSHEGYVAKLYENVLGRPGEAGGVAFWVSQLGTGARDDAQVLADFSESAENIAAVGVTISDGFFLA